MNFSYIYAVLATLCNWEAIKQFTLNQMITNLHHKQASALLALIGNQEIRVYYLCETQ